jgi:hypothetical protein
MKRFAISLSILLTPLLIIASPIEDNAGKNVLNAYLKCMYNGVGTGWLKDRQGLDTLVSQKDWVTQETDYWKQIHKIDKTMTMDYGESAYFVLSYSVDSIRLINKYALCFVSYKSIAEGYVLDDIKINQLNVCAKYILVKENGKWVVVGHPDKPIISPYVYLEWANKELKTRVWSEGQKYKDNVTKTVKRFRAFLKVK